MNVSRISWEYSFFSLLLFVAGVAEKLCTALSDLYPRWEEGDRLGGIGQLLGFCWQGLSQFTLRGSNYITRGAILKIRKGQGSH